MKEESEPSSIPVFFSKRKIAQGQLPEAGVVITPDSDEWNDFALRTRFEYRVLENGETLIEGSLHLGFLDTGESPADRVRQLLRDSAEPLRRAKDFPSFFTLLPSMQGYRDLVQKTGAKRARQFLRVMNDMVVVQRKKARPSWFAKAQATRAFQRSFMRSSEAFFAFHNAAPVLAGLAEERFDGISFEWRLRFKLPTFSNPHELDIVFTEEKLPPRRIVVIIGKNGTGKSRALHNIVASALAGDKRLRKADGGRPMLNRLLAIESPGETQATFPAEKLAADSKVFYRRVALDRSGKRGLGRGLTSLFVRLARNEDHIGERRRWKLFERAVGELLPWDEIHVRLKEGILDTDGEPISRRGREWIPLSRLGYGGERDKLDLWARVDSRVEPCRETKTGHVPLSSGQITFIRFAAQLCLNIENGTLLLLDEPETHMHPNLITDFVALLNELLNATGSLAIIATHSSYFVRETPGSQVVVLREPEAGLIEVTTPRLKTLGADVGALSRFVFGDKMPSLVLAELRRSFAQQPKQRKRALAALREVLPTEALMYLERKPESSPEDPR
jgi:predicted ATPase